MFRRFVIFFLVFIFLLPGYVSAHSEVTVIEMTPEGFQPSEITVDENSSVIFLNKDKESRWPASNTHPTHELYPEFDPRKPIAPGESWPFKPENEGTWKFHDHLFPHMRGAITVIKEKNSEKKESPEKEKKTNFSLSTFFINIKDRIKRIVDNIKNLFGSEKKQTIQVKLPAAADFKKLTYATQAKKLREAVESNDVSYAWTYVKDVFKNDGGSSGNIHDLAHLAGILIYEKEGFEGITKCSSEFAFGCYHGFLDKAFSKNLDHVSDAQDACLKLNSQGNKGIEGPVASCIHGIGHGIASYYSTSDLKKSLSSCRKLTSGNEYCFDGVFMEFVRSAPDSFFKKADLLYPCNMLEKEFGYAYSFSCGRNQPSLLMGRFNISFSEVINVCLKSSSKPFKEACFDSLGFSVSATGDVEKIIGSCQSIEDPQFVNRCIQAAAGEMVFQEIPGWHEKSRDVCNGSYGEKDICLQHVQRLMKEYQRQIPVSFTPKSENEDINSYVRNQLKKCYENEGRDGCYKQAAQILYDQFGLSQTLKTIQTNEQYPQVYARCHEVTHYLSRLEYEKQHSIPKVYALCDSTCHGGCYHGTIEAYLKEKTDEAGTDLHNQFAKICGKSSDYEKPLEYNECLHGLGHAAMFVTDMELKESLKFCDTIQNQEHKERCYTGVFMENSSSSTSFDHVSKYIKKDDPFYPCNTLEEKYLSLCWQYQSSYFSIINNQDWEKVAQLCLQIPALYHDKCFRTIGTNQVGFTQSLEIMKKDCDLMPSGHFKNVCVEGVVSSLAYRFVGDTQKMINFCLMVDLENRESCFKQIGSGVSDWNKNKDVVRKECLKIPDSKGQSWCMSVI